MAYVIDTSGLIGAWQRTYPPEVFPALWDNLEVLGETGQLLVPEEVHRELKRQSDDLYDWVEQRKAQIVVPTDRAVLVTVRAILADHPRLTMPGTGRGLADPFVIAQAELRRCPLITEERGGAVDKPRIPYVCSVRGVESMGMLSLIRREGWTF